MIGQLLRLPAQWRVRHAWRQSLARCPGPDPLLDPLIPCLVSGRKTLIVPAELGSADYRALAQRVARLSGDWQLLRDRRSTSQPVAKERRAWQLAALLQGLLGFALLPLQAGAQAQSLEPVAGQPVPAVADDSAHRSLALVAPTTGVGLAEEHQSPFSPSRYTGKQAPLVIDEQRHSQRKQQVLQVLQKKWRAKRSAPEFVADDIDSIADYIAARDEAYTLVMQLRRQPWNMVYRAGEFRSEVKGSRLGVNSVSVYFDTRSAARFASTGRCTAPGSNPGHAHGAQGHCAITPVDALLHELLHVRAALMDTRAFLRSGAMAGGGYPHKHEQAILSQERELFAAMSARDAMPRPQRNRHSGQIVAAACVTCVGG